LGSAGKKEKIKDTSLREGAEGYVKSRNLTAAEEFRRKKRRGKKSISGGGRYDRLVGGASETIHARNKNNLDGTGKKNPKNTSKIRPRLRKKRPAETKWPTKMERKWG